LPGRTPSWGYDRIAGALSNLGHKVSDQTVGNVLHRHGIAPAPKRGQTTGWKDFIASHMSVIAGMDFFTVEILTWRGLITYYVLFAIQLETRKVILAGISRHHSKPYRRMDRTSCTQLDGFRIRHTRSPTVSPA
jgi:putative transposase